MTNAIRVLYVDDEPELLIIGKRYLEKSKEFDIHILTSAKEALNYLKEHEVDAIISDYEMSDINGIEFLKILRARKDDTPFIIFTGRGREEVVIDALNAGADFYLQKGGDPKPQYTELIHKIRTAIHRRMIVGDLIEYQKRLEEIIDFLPDATLAIDTSGSVIAWNRAIEQMTGVSKEEILNKGEFIYALPFYHEQCPTLIDCILHNDIEIQKKCRYIKREGEKLISEIFIPHFNKGVGAHLWCTASPLYDTKGNLTGAIESIRDITDHVHDRLLIQESEEKQRLLAHYHQILSQTSILLTEATDEGMVVSTIADSLMWFTGAITTMVIVHHQETGELCGTYQSYQSDYVARLEHLLGGSLSSMRWPVSELLQQKMMRQPITRSPEIHALPWGDIPTGISTILKDEFSIKDIVVLTLQHNNILLGATIAFLQTAHSDLPDDVLKTFAYLSSLAMTRKRVEKEIADAHRRAEEKSKQLEEHLQDLQLMTRLTIGRELQMIKLKKEVNGLYARLGERSTYDINAIEEI
jgi:PAS domain S-box-containing protein